MAISPVSSWLIFCKMCCVSGMSGDLQLIREGFFGDIYLHEGKIVHAQAGLYKGERALHFLLSFRQGSFEFDKGEMSPEETIHGQWEYLLLEAARLRDESMLRWEIRFLQS